VSRAELAVLTRQLLARLEDADELVLPPGPPKAAHGPDVPLFHALQERVEACRNCALGSTRLRSVFGVGDPHAKVLLVGEGPGFQEDHQGEPFVGKAGQLLDKILQSIGLSRDTVYIANIVKCHPMLNPADPEARGNDRPPTPEEIAACRPYLDEQIRLIAPKVIVALGSVATKTLLGEDVSITRARGLWRDYRVPGEARTIRLLPTFHPAALLRNPELKRDVWTDMKNLKKALEEEA
jgi:DNA polymerase